MTQSHLETTPHFATESATRTTAFNRSSNRLGLTLVELLVVVGVVSVLAAVVLPSVKTVLTDRKSSQAAIVVRNFIDAARARAIGKNRSVAVVLERLSSRAQWDPTANGGSGGYVSETASGSIMSPDTNWVPYNACIRMSLAEEPMPINEAMLSAPVTITARSPGDGLNPSIPNPGGYTGQDQLIDADQIAGWPEVRIFRVASS
ncbi:MAG: prepilin-type N-terminal cleavage/methylation domain-containing protein, partial [Pirellula sp.]